MKFPKLLRKQYLNYSPLWKAYLNGKYLDPQICKINSKLYSAYFVSQIIKSSSKPPINNEFMDKFNQYWNEIKEFQASREDVDEPLQRTKNFLEIYKNKESNNKVYIEKIFEMYHNIDKLSAQKQDEISKITQQSLNRSLSNHQKVKQYVELLVKISKNIGLDDIDLLILQTLPIDSQLLYELSKSKIQWSNTNQYIVMYFGNKFMQEIKKGEWTHFAELKDLLNKLKTINGNSQQTVNKNQIETVFRNALLGLISSGASKKDITIESIKILMKKLDGQKQIRFHTYLQLLNHQFLLYLDWLAMKCLYRPTSGAFIVNLREFCEKINYFDIETLLKSSFSNKAKYNKSPNKNTSEASQSLFPSKQQAKHLKQLSLKQKLCKLQIATYLYNQFAQTASTSQTKTSAKPKLLQFSKQKIGIETFNQLRNIKLTLQQQIQKIFKPNPKQSTKTQPIKSMLQKNLKPLSYIFYAIDIINMNNPSSLRRSRLSNQLLNQLLQKYFIQIIKIDIILLSKMEKELVYKILKYVSNKDSNQIMEYEKKIRKYIQEKQQQSVNDEKYSGKQLRCSAQSKYLWQILTNPTKNTEQTNIYYNQQFLKSIKQSLFLFSNIKQKNNEKIQHIYNFFN